MSEEVTDELREIYLKAYDDGIWLREFGSPPGSDTYMAAAGSISKLEEIEKQTGEEIDVSELELGDVVNVSLPGTGKTREEACRNAIQAYNDYQKKDESIELCGSFEEKGYKIEAYLPNRPPVEWVVKAYKSDKLMKEIHIPMIHPPLCGPHMDDVATLEKKVDELLKELP